mmetsp:Transcript_7903/g.15449  ORF Transcript_7903/g.15449 Transcript_7903/m.15449 type:complete len:225 (-) Transcript_7903:715-1389(-)
MSGREGKTGDSVASNRAGGRSDGLYRSLVSGFIRSRSSSFTTTSELHEGRTGLLNRLDDRGMLSQLRLPRNNLGSWPTLSDRASSKPLSVFRGLLKLPRISEICRPSDFLSIKSDFPTSVLPLASTLLLPLALVLPSGMLSDDFGALDLRFLDIASSKLTHLLSGGCFLSSLPPNSLDCIFCRYSLSSRSYRVLSWSARVWKKRLSRFDSAFHFLPMILATVSL